MSLLILEENIEVPLSLWFHNNISCVVGESIKIYTITSENTPANVFI